MTREFILNFLNLVINALTWLILIRVILSWFPAGLGKFSEFIFDITEPILRPLQKLIPPVGGMLDLSPIAAFIILQIVQSLINRYL